MRGLISHLRYTVRLLLKSPGFTVPTVLVLALGIGSNTAIFSLVNGVLLKPLPYPKADRLVAIHQTVPGFDRFTLDYPDYLDFRRQQGSFEDIGAYYGDRFTITGRGEAEVISGMYATGNLFKVLARPFLLGTPFGETEGKSETRAVAVISERLWKTKFQQDLKVIGATLSLDGRSFEIVGVTPPQGNEGGGADVYLPLNQFPYLHDLETSRGSHVLGVIGRLKDRVTLPQARADLEAISKRLSADYPATNTKVGVGLISYLDWVVGDYSASLWLLEASVACLLLITCANVANLLIARAQERRREVTIRAALGASRKRLFAQLLLETLVLALIGGILGLVLGFWGVHLIKLVCPEDVSRFQEIAIDGASLIFVLSVTVGTALLAGVLPAFAGSNADLTPALGEGGERTGTGSRASHRKQSFLVAGQVALTFALLTAAGLLTRSYQALHETPLGFNPKHILIGDIYLRGSKYSDTTKCRLAWDAILDRFARLPGVGGATMNTDLPFKSGGATLFGIEGQPDPEPGKEPAAEPQVVSENYFSVLGIPLLRGRAFENQDRPDSERVVIIGNSVAQQFFSGQDPIGKQLNDLGDKAGQKRVLYTIVGVVPDVEHNSPDGQHATFQLYYPYAQSSYALDSGTLVLSVEQEPNSVLPAVRKTLTSVDPDLPFAGGASFDQLVEKGFAGRRLSMLVVTLFSGAALLLATVGLYAVLSYSVAQRRREIGVRIALGAQVHNILQLVITQGLRIGAIGLLIGVFATAILARLIQGLLYQVPSTDPLTFLTAGSILCLAALIACLFPAIRATRVDPIKALRE
jgi:putative ABC transport system permease protein